MYNIMPLNETPSFEQLIDEFEKLPKIVIESTYLELCKYPGSKFEEVCSRLLSFYFNPNNEHGFNDLFLECFLQLIAPNQQIAHQNKEVEVITELNVTTIIEHYKLNNLHYAEIDALKLEDDLRECLNKLENYSKNIEDKL
ncbi:MAG: hypothetical protein EOO93_14195 [Pedobacter sp.]|nr:MAG: hypothetical protein EOO93_14195 [Pedobacter sp.]